MDKLQVDRQALKRDCQGFGDGAKALDQVFKALDAALSAEGNCWGNDDTGKAFFSKYDKPRQEAYNSFSGLAKRLRQTEHNLQQTAGGYDGAEDASTI